MESTKKCLKSSRNGIKIKSGLLLSSAKALSRQVASIVWNLRAFPPDKMSAARLAITFPQLTGFLFALPNCSLTRVMSFWPSSGILIIGILP